MVLSCCFDWKDPATHAIVLTATAGVMASKCAQMYEKLNSIPTTCWPIVYSHNYNITFFGMEKLHPFDSVKWQNVFNFLQEAKMLTPTTVVCPEEITEEQLLEFHKKSYIDSLRWSVNVAKITEVPPVAFLPNFIVQRRLLKNLRLQTSGTILAAKLALDRGWAMNIGGGFHHCSAERGGGFCAYADISGALKTLHSQGLIQRALIIDLDAHQGNGHERDFTDTDWVHTLDVYNNRIYPFDTVALEMNNLIPVHLSPYTQDDRYLEKVDSALDDVFKKLADSMPDIIAYNAGTDCMANDPLGALDVTPQGIIKRDELVFRKAKEMNVPVFMVLSGGYQRETARVIADSVLNLKEAGLIYLPNSSSESHTEL